MKPAVLPRRDVATRNANSNQATRQLALPGNRAASSDRQRNLPPDARNQVDRGRIVGTRPDSRPAVVRPGQNTHPARNPELGRVVGTKPWWSGEQAGVNRNFRQNVNWSTGRRHWGYSPWWNRSYVRPWYGGCWNWGWNRAYYHNNYCYSGWYWGYRLPGYVVYDSYYPVGWGLIGWGLGSLVYDIGYSSYYNPYPVSVPVSSQGLDVSYTEPLARLAAESAPADETAVEENTRKSESYVVESQSAFKQRNYLVALEFADKAIAESPGDGALHEYRALVLFALGKYGDAAGVLNPVIASGPGWDWTTMIALYDSQETYTDQLRKLEAYTKAKPGDAGSYFLLGYHYMVCGQLDLATPQFELAARLMPADKVSKDLAQLTRFTTKDASESVPAEGAAEAPAVEPVPLEKLTGVWVSTRESGTITLTFKDDGKFTWLFDKNGRTTEFAGDFSINDNGMLVLKSLDSQMVASVALPAESEMKFVLAGGPPADPGLEFKKH